MKYFIDSVNQKNVQQLLWTAFLNCTAQEKYYVIWIVGVCFTQYSN